MVHTKEFKLWHQREVHKKLWISKEIEEALKNSMDPRNLKLEVQQDGKWVPVDFNAPLDVNEENLTVK